MIQWTRAKVFLYSDSVLCRVKMNDGKGAIERWEGQVEEFKMSASYAELTGIDGGPIEFESNISQELHHCRFFKRFRTSCKIGTLNLRN